MTVKRYCKIFLPNIRAYFLDSIRGVFAGRVRMVFVADRIPTELQRIIEFLNGQMTQADVLGVEVRQYESEDGQVLAPTFIGRTAVAERTKGAGGQAKPQSIGHSRA